MDNRVYVNTNFVEYLRNRRSRFHRCVVKIARRYRLVTSTVLVAEYRLANINIIGFLKRYSIQVFHVPLSYLNRRANIFLAILGITRSKNNYFDMMHVAAADNIKALFLTNDEALVKRINTLKKLGEVDINALYLKKICEGL